MCTIILYNNSIWGIFYDLVPTTSKRVMGLSEKLIKTNLVGVLVKTGAKF